MINLNNISLVKKNQLILKELSFTIVEGDVIGITGPSGSGKTSLLRLLNLLDSPSNGEIVYCGKALQTYNPLCLRKEIGYVFQKPYLFGHTVLENLTYPYQMLKQKPNIQEIQQYLEQVNLPPEIITHKNTELSGGEQQRIALIRTLLLKPRVLLLDEVTASLDEENTRLIEKLIMVEKKARQLTVVLITHNLIQAERLAQKILYLVNGEVKFYGSNFSTSNLVTRKGIDGHE
ncbi:MAG: ATP-binding cassette domain-containing protein [Carboxydocellales bacterium]